MLFNTQRFAKPFKAYTVIIQEPGNSFVCGPNHLSGFYIMVNDSLQFCNFEFKRSN